MTPLQQILYCWIATPEVESAKANIIMFKELEFLAVNSGWQTDEALEQLEQAALKLESVNESFTICVKIASKYPRSKEDNEQSGHYSPIDAKSIRNFKEEFLDACKKDVLWEDVVNQEAETDSIILALAGFPGRYFIK